MNRQDQKASHLDHLLQLLIVMLVLWPLKGICSHQHHVHHDPTGPYVGNLQGQIEIIQSLLKARSPAEYSSRMLQMQALPSCFLGAFENRPHLAVIRLSLCCHDDLWCQVGRCSNP